MQRLDLALGDDHLDVCDLLRQLLESGPGLALLEVGAHPRPQRLGLPDVENSAFLVPEEVDARRGWQALQRAFRTISSLVASVATASLAAGTPWLLRRRARPRLRARSRTRAVRPCSSVRPPTWRSRTTRRWHRQIVRAKAAGANAVRLTAWPPGQTELDGDRPRRTAERRLRGQRQPDDRCPRHPASRQPDDTADRRTADVQFATFTASVARAVPHVKHFTIGNEPNLNRFWLPQFGPAGENVAAPAYLRFLTAAYDALKAVDEDLQVPGGALSPRGSDNPALSRHTHSPTKFIKGVGIAYRASGRTKPVMDALDQPVC